ncbi:TetR/AcrR family transcriptional regulator [Desertihabitans aurantiacus]|uniref:TetR/AcrR family transcriptional regulator n=1 Tax=Desertihabitans aurantiacus TaxID=2282477 RepID=UPI000DF7EE6F|nr:TetR/AcrR family transcriptional regulator [Desertihabitans aurantiacus]
MAGRRAYRSELRAQQAEETRRRVVRAAAELFARTGYQSTTLAAIARTAGVSTETVKGQGSKAALLLAAFETTFAGSEGRTSLADTEVGAGVLEVPDEQFLPAVVEILATANERGHALWTVVLAAALSDPVVAEALEQILQRRHADLLRLLDELRRRGIASPDAPDSVAAELSFLGSPEAWQQLVVQSGWAREAYTAWLLRSVTAAAARAGGQPD